MSIEEAYNFRRFDERLTTSGVVTVEQLHDLRRGGYDAVINLLPDSHEHAVPGEARIVEELGLDYVSIPVDFDAPTHADLVAFTEAMDTRAGRRVHVHCAANYRVSAFLALYLLGNRALSEPQADALVHDVWDPYARPAWNEFMMDEVARARSEPRAPEPHAEQETKRP